MQSNKNSIFGRKGLYFGLKLVYTPCMKQNNITEDKIMQKHRFEIFGYIKVISFIVMLGMAEPVASMLLR